MTSSHGVEEKDTFDGQRWKGRDPLEVYYNSIGRGGRRIRRNLERLITSYWTWQ